MKLKNPLANVVKDENATKEMMRFLQIGWVLSGIALFILPFLAYAGIAFGARAAVLAHHAGTKGLKNLRKYQLASYALVALSAFEIWALLSRPNQQ